MSRLISSHDWSRSPLGPVSTWPQSLRTSLSILVESGYPMYIAWGADYVQFYNDAYRPILGSTKHPSALGESTRVTFAEIWPVIGPMFDAVMQSGRRTDVHDQLLPLDRNGYLEECYFDWSYSPIRDESGSVGGVFVTCSETTQRVLGERRLRLLRDLATLDDTDQKPEEALSSAVEVLSTDPDDIPFSCVYLLDGTGEAAHLVHASGLEDPRMLPEVCSPDDGPWPMAVGQLVPEGLAVSLNDLFPGREWPGEASEALLIPLLTSQDTPSAFIVLGISPRRALDEQYRSFFQLVAGQLARTLNDVRARAADRERARQLAELDRAKTAFFSNVSHEFRTPLALILGPVEELIRSPAIRADQREQLETVYRNGMRLLRLVNSLLDFARIEAGRVDATFEPTDLGSLTADVASAFRSAIERAGLRFVVESAPSEVTVYVDRDMWEKIVLNLLSNALKYTHTGDIRITTRVESTSYIVAVQDTGVGIPEHELPKLFTRFHRVAGVRGRTQEGSGIGLALVSELVHIHGGDVEVESIEGIGSTFTVRIPMGTDHLPQDRIGTPHTLSPTSFGSEPFLQEARRWSPDEAPASERTAEAPSTIADESSRRPAGPMGRTILIADDNADMREYLVRLLGTTYEIVAVSNGQQALEALTASQPDLVITDVMMPDMDGFELLRAIRTTHGDESIPVIMLSARAGEEARIEGIQAGADDYLTKPFSARELVARVDAQLRMAELRAEATTREREALERIHHAMQEAPAAICLLEGPDFVFTFANAKYRELTGGRPLIGLPVRVAFPDIEGQGFFELLDGVRKTGKPFVGSEIPVQLSHADDERQLYINLIYAPIRGADQAVESIFVLVNDVTNQVEARKVVEEARHAAEAAVHAREELLSIASHELRNPVAAIAGAAQMLRRSHDAGRLDSERLDRYASIIYTSSTHLARLTSDLLDVSRLERGHLSLRLEQVDFQAIVGTAVADLALGERRLEWHATVDHAPVKADPDRLRQVLTNLLENAIKYSPESSCIHVSLEPEADGYLLTIRDEGIGLPPGQHERIFEPFGRADNAAAAGIPGIGLGLYISRQIAEAHLGRLAADSAGLDEGTSLRLWLPASDGGAHLDD